MGAFWCGVNIVSGILNLWCGQPGNLAVAASNFFVAGMLFSQNWRRK